MAASAALAQSDPLEVPFPATLELGDLDGDSGFRIDGVAEGDNSGRSVASVGDMNGDGIADVVIGAPNAEPGGQVNEGSTFVVFGRVGSYPAELQLSDLNGANGFRINGVEEFAASGTSVASAGDVNNDGIDDLIIGAWLAEPGGRFQAGSSFVIFGRDLPGGDRFPASLDLDELDGRNGFRMDGAEGDWSGLSVASAGDINLDGIDDVVIGAPLGDFGDRDSGVAYVLFGRDLRAGDPFPPTIELASLDGENGSVLGGVAAGENTGQSVAQAGDVNGDGADDLIVGATTARPDGRTTIGSAFILFGREDFRDRTPLADLNGRDGFRVDGAAENDAFGAKVASAGDINGDGVDDVVIGAPNGDPGGRDRAGRSAVVFGRDARSGETFPRAIAWAEIDGVIGFRFVGISEDDQIGRAAASAGDLNNDGIGDLIIGADNVDIGGDSNAGQAYVVFGRDGGSGASFPAVLRLVDLDGQTGFRIDGAAAFDRAGSSVAPAGDVNGDGMGDVIIGASGADPRGRSRAGSSYVVFGRAPIDCPADLNGDGVLNIFDFLDFQNLFAAQDPIADFDGDGSFTIFDFLAFQNAFVAGCG